MNFILDDLAFLTGLGRDWLTGAFLVFLRVGAVMALLPAFGEQNVPVRVRLALSIAFTGIVLPGVVDGLHETSGLPALFTEVVAGLVLGIGLRLFVMALQVAGSMAAQAASLSQLFASAGAEPQPALSHVLVTAGLALAVAGGLHVQLAKALILSYQVFPPGDIPLSADVASWGLAGISHAFALAFSLAAPFTAAALIYNLALGVINRAMPQLMVSFIGAPALALGGIVLLALAAPPGLALWHQALRAHLVAPFEAPR